MRSRTACAAASARRLARRIRRAPTCCTARATRYSRRGVSLRHFDEFGDVADHCTVCHKCLNPCPVDIDFGDVSIAMRNLLRKEGRRKFNIGTAASMFFLNATDPATIRLAKTVMIDLGYRAQRLAYAAVKKAGAARAQTAHPPSTTGRTPIKAQV